MTTKTRDMRPDFWKPYWIAYAEYEGRKVVLADTDLVVQGQFDDWLGHPALFVGVPPGVAAQYRYWVNNTAPCRHVCCCPFPDAEHADILAATDDEAEARAAFDRACEELRR